MIKIVNSNFFNQLLLFLWTKPIYKEEEVIKVICKVCSKIREKSCALVARSDNLQKNQGKKATKRLGHGVAIGENRMNYSSNYDQNNRLFATNRIDASEPEWVSPQLQIGRRNGYSWSPLLQLLIQGRPITTYEHMYMFFETSKLKSNPHHHWSDISGWERWLQNVWC